VSVRVRAVVRPHSHQIQRNEYHIETKTTMTTLACQAALSPQ